MRGTKLLSTIAALAGLGAAAKAHAIEWYFQTPGSQLARDIDHLHQYVMWLIIVIFVAVFGFMFWACYAHRKSKGHAAEQFHENTTVELLWTVIPAIILVVIAWPVTKVVISQKDTSAPDITIKVTGIQWKWGYDYVKGEGEGISFVSMLTTPREQIEGDAPKGEHYLLEVDNELVVPVGKKIRVLTTAADVVHSWWVPAFGAKEAHMDIVLNGKPNTAMAAFKQQLNDTDIAAVITYERNSWSNKAGLVQPAEVKARRK